MDRRTWTRSDEVAPLPSLLARQPQDSFTASHGRFLVRLTVRMRLCGNLAVMSLKTSIYLSDELTARVKASPLPLSELVRRGLEAPDLEAMLRRVLREERAGVSVADVRSPARYERDDYAHEPYEDSA